MPSIVERPEKDESAEIIGFWKVVSRTIKSLDAMFDRAKMRASEVNQHLTNIRSFCRIVIFSDLVFAVKHQVEDILWESHVKVHSWYCRVLKAIGQDKRKEVQKRKITRHFLDFIKSSQRFYRTHIRSFIAHYGDVAGLRELLQEDAAVTVQKRMAAFDEGETAIIDEGRMELIDKEETAAREPALEKAHVNEMGNDGIHELAKYGNFSRLPELVFNSFFSTTIRLGDLSRWHARQALGRKVNLTPSVAFYKLALFLRPGSGLAQNQLAATATLIRETPETPMRNFLVIYHSYLALLSSNPHLEASTNLTLVFKKFIKQMASHNPSRQQMAEHKLALRLYQDSVTLSDLIWWAARLHERCRTSNLTFVEYQSVEADVVKYMLVNLKQIPMSTVLQKIVLLNIAGEYEAKERFKAIPTGLEEHKAGYFTKMNIRMFTVLVQHLGHMMQVASGQAGYLSRPPVGRMTPPLRSILPGLRHYSSWITCNFENLHRVLPAGRFHDELRIDLAKMWAEYADTLSILVHCFSRDDLKAPLDYLLPEDDEVLGFLPFESKKLKRRFLGAHEYRKPKPSGRPRAHLDREMLARIQGLISDGMFLALEPYSPLVQERRQDGRPKFRLEPTNISKPVSPPPPTATARQTPGPAPQTTVRETMEAMVDNLVGPDETPEKIAFTFLAFPPLTPDYPSTPPQKTFDGPLDRSPFTPHPAPRSTPLDVLALPDAMRQIEATIERSTMKYQMAHGTPKYT